MPIIRYLWLIFLLLLLASNLVAKSGAPDILLAQVYQSGLDVTQHPLGDLQQ